MDKKCDKNKYGGIIFDKHTWNPEREHIVGPHGLYVRTCLLCHRKEEYYGRGYWDEVK